ncbi:MAG: hypothetical protein A2511_10715 [Deltaproteobacteria bacterium RIFOXYD12_FULL_50_9]|nr:MAG: hypothetical protein A2511_10715 [Deltaproteobacteria bacterium RIFOXYD12_FULL_50_9]
MDCLHLEKDGSITILIYVQPRSSKTAIQGFHAGALKLCTTAPPVDGKANTAITQFIAKFFGIPKSGVTLKKGDQSRHKSFSLKGLTLDQAQAALAEI